MNRLLPLARSIFPLAALVLLVGACSSTQSSLNQNGQPVPARAAGTVETRWGSMPSYTCDKGSPIALNPQGIPTPAPSWAVEVDLLVERDGTVRDVAMHRTSTIPDLDAVLVAKFKEARSVLVLASSDPAPYVIRYNLNHLVELADASRSQIPLSSPNDYRYVNDRPMGTGQPVAGDHPYRN